MGIGFGIEKIIKPGLSLSHTSSLAEDLKKSTGLSSGGMELEV
jgi:hypothetical protein